MSKATLLLMVAATMGLGALKTYEVVPCSNYIAVKTQGDEPITQYFRNTVDSLTAVWVWVGDTVDTGNFRVEVRDSLTDDLLAQSRPGGEHADRRWFWLVCSLFTTNGMEPVRGRSYRLTVSRTSGSPVEFAYSPFDSSRSMR